MKIVGVMAVCKTNNVIGNKGRLPWNYPEELEFFKQITSAHPMVMGRKTFESMPSHVFDLRPGIIFSRTLDKDEFNYHNCYLVSSMEEFLKLTKTLNDEMIFMIGGTEIAKLFLEANLIDKFILTKIHKNYPGDTFFDLSLLKNWPEQMIIQNDYYSIYELANPNSIL